MQFDEQPMLALNKAIKYGTILLCGIFIVPVLKYLNIYNRKVLGYSEPRIFFVLNTIKGFFLSILLLTPLIIFYDYLGVRNINDIDLSILNKTFFYIVIYTLFISFIISIIEESYFRGIMIQKKINLIPIISTIIFSSLIYSLFHFIKIPLIIDENIVWNTGLIELSNVFINLFRVISYDAAITLFVFGILLALIRLRYQTISYCIGFHAGFIFMIKIFKQNSSVNYETSYSFYLSSYDQFTGSIATIWIMLILIIYLIYIYKVR
ncbi:MAG: type II CAAX prenyl endopeptidase Rce1 family protein [Gammaproteobacteria bacterium]|tara:strand:- start:11685 stop:12479 length:795 start_codon:yes stop_codon:yes gene_type:complete